jgi:hypothetical protein
MKTVMSYVNVIYNDNDKSVTFSEPDLGMGETSLTIPFCQLECIYNEIRKINGEKENG